MSHLVRGVMAPSSSSGVILKPVSAPQRTITGVPSATRTISGYDTHAGVGITTSSPSSSVACSAL